jgi:hypothetical protein
VVGAADDAAEHDADRRADVALAHLRRLGSDPAGQPSVGETHQHPPGCDHLRRTVAGGTVGLEGGPVPDETASRIDRLRPSGVPLAEPVRRRMETAFGTGLGGVRIHVGEEPARLNRAVSARAFTTGRDIFFGKGEFAPGTASGERVLAHELAHTLQPAGPVQRTSTLRRVASVYRSDEDLKKMTLSAFDAHAVAQADWAVSPEIAADKEALRSLLSFARADDGLVLGSCGRFLVSDLLAGRIGQSVDTRDPDLARYSRDVSADRRRSITITKPAERVVDAVAWGAAIGELEGKIAPWKLMRAIPQTEESPCLGLLVTAGRVTDLVTYVLAVGPVLDAFTGADIHSFIEFCAEGGLTKYAGYRSALPQIRDYHRFTVPQLDALARNHAAGPANAAGARQPVCVVLQSGYDEVGVFHRDDNLTAVIERTTFLTVLAQGSADLGALTTHLATFATWGPGGKIDELMISGHGNAQVMQLAGEPYLSDENDGYQEGNRTLTVDPTADTDDRDASRNLMGEIVRVLRDDADSRVVLNACLTASNSVTAELSADPGTAATEIQDAIRADPSLATALQLALGTARGQVLGANGSFGQSGLLKGGRIDIELDTDDALTGSKLRYVAEGADAEGVLRATLESWSDERGPTIEAARVRVASTESETGWEKSLIRELLRIVVANPDNASVIQALAGSAAALAELPLAAKCLAEAVPEILAAVPTDHRDAILTSLSQNPVWSDAPDRRHLPAVLLQVWALHSPDKVADLLAFLDRTTFTTQDAADRFALTSLETLLARLVPTPDVVATPPRGTFLMALLYMVDRKGAAPKPVIEYITAVAGPTSGFPDTCGVAALLVGRTAQQVLQDAGVLSESGATSTSTPAPMNLDPARSGENSLRVESVTWKRRTPPDTPAGAYLQPSGDPAAEIPGGTNLHVIGRTTGERRKSPASSTALFLAVEHTVGSQHTVFVLADEVVE